MQWHIGNDNFDAQKSDFMWLKGFDWVVAQKKITFICCHSSVGIYLNTNKRTVIGVLKLEIFCSLCGLKIAALIGFTGLKLESLFLPKHCTSEILWLECSPWVCSPHLHHAFEERSRERSHSFRHWDHHVWTKCEQGISYRGDGSWSTRFLTSWHEWGFISPNDFWNHGLPAWQDHSIISSGSYIFVYINSMNSLFLDGLSFQRLPDGSYCFK